MEVIPGSPRVSAWIDGTEKTRAEVTLTFASEAEAAKVSRFLDTDELKKMLQGMGSDAQAIATGKDIVLSVTLSEADGLALVEGIFGPKHTPEQETHLMVMELAQKGYLQWTLKTNETCPESLSALAPYTNHFEGKQKIQDVWKQDLIMVCGENPELPDGVMMGVLSVGPDGQRGTVDDIKSWEKKSGTN
jgi:hypothetical protein